MIDITRAVNKPKATIQPLNRSSYLIWIPFSLLVINRWGVRRQTNGTDEHL